jgi:hypothetical protein
MIDQELVPGLRECRKYRLWVKILDFLGEKNILKGLLLSRRVPLPYFAARFNFFVHMIFNAVSKGTETGKLPMWLSKFLAMLKLFSETARFFCMDFLTQSRLKKLFGMLQRI